MKDKIQEKQLVSLIKARECRMKKGTKQRDDLDQVGHYVEQVQKSIQLGWLTLKDITYTYLFERYLGY